MQDAALTVEIADGRPVDTRRIHLELELCLQALGQLLAACRGIGEMHNVADVPYVTDLNEQCLFGMGAECHTLEEVGQQFSVTRERIRQSEAKALRKLKHPSRSRKLRSFLHN
jgi:hypothetical protein